MQAAGRILKEALVKRANIAVVILLAIVSTAGCAASGSPGADESGPQPSTRSSATPQRGSACLITPTTGEVTVMVDWVDFVQLHGIQYIADLDGSGPLVASDQLGSAVGQVECQLSVLKFQAQPGPAVDGDAAFLAVGTELRAIRGYEPSCRVAARIDGINRV